MMTLKELSEQLQTPLRKLCWILGHVDHLFDEFYLVDPNKPQKRRLIVNPKRPLREIQQRFYRSVLLKEFVSSEFSHGGVAGKSILTNLRQHLGQQYVFTADISDFFPSIRPSRIRGLFRAAGWSSDAASSAARLCTYKHHLAQGLITSPFLADQMLKTVDCRIGAACARHSLVYTRFIDDISISGKFDLQRSGIPAIVSNIIREHGFGLNQTKSKFGSVSSGATITRLRFRRGHIDVSKEYIKELESQIEDSRRIARGCAPNGNYFAENQIQGRIQFVCWVNHFRKASLLRLFHSVDWKKVHQEAARMGLQKCKKRLIPIKLMGTEVPPR